MMTPDETASRYAGHRPGFELIHFEEVALPYYRVVLDSLIQERKPISPIEEFVLRSVEAGITGIDDIAGLLGLDRALAEQAVVSLNQLDHLDYRLEGDERVLRMTPLGTKALGGWKEMVPRREEILIGFDRLAWRSSGKHYSSLMRPKDARAAGLRELPPKLKKRLRPLDLDLEEAQAAMEDIARRSLKDAQLIGVKDVGNHQMVLPAVALVFASEGGRDQQVAIVIDGRISDEHENAFAEIDGPSRVGLVVSDAADQSEHPVIELPATIEAGDKAKVRELQQRISRASHDVKRAETRTATAEASSEDVVAAEVTEKSAAEALRDAKRELDAMPVRSIQTYEHPVLLNDALGSAQNRLLIISPWIRGDVVNQEFLGRLQACLKRNVKVHIGWGISDEDDEREQRPLKKLREFEDRYENFVLSRLGNTHAKVLVWDDNIVVTSFNWLSFRGDKDRSFRQEEGMLISVSDIVDVEYRKYKAQVSAAAG